MKKIFSLLLLFTAFLGQSQTYQNVLDLINLNLQSGTKITAVKHREVEIALLDYIQSNLSQSGDIKVIKSDTAYLNANFEANGLGKNLRLGWAICNGNNGTPNFNGRVIVGYGSEYPTINAIGGSKDAVLVNHSHKSVSTVNPSSEYTDTNKYTAAFRTAGGDVQYGLQGTATIPTRGDTTQSGESGTDKNMQPYIVQIYIMKL
jgi:hypothetical protein